MTTKTSHAEYERERWRIRRDDALERLGGHCVECSTLDDLEFDHVDPKTKLFNLLDGMPSDARFEAELLKCQLLCYRCHKTKSDKEITGPREHGTHAAHRRGKCRCQICRDFFNDYRRKLRASKNIRE